MSDFGFTPGELRALRALGSPHGVQRALDAMPYHHGATAWSPRRVLREGTAHCLEGAIFAAAALRVLGRPPLLVDLEAVQDTDHVLCVYRTRGHWGAIAKSNFTGLRYAFPHAMAGLEPTLPLVIALRDRVAARPRIAAYLRSKRRQQFNRMGIFRHYPELDAKPSRPRSR